MKILSKIVLTLFFVTGFFTPALAYESPFFSLKWGTGVDDFVAYMGAPYKLDVVEATVSVPPEERGWAKQTAAQYGAFLIKQYRYIETVNGQPAEMIYNFFQDKLFGKACIIDADGIALDDAKALAGMVAAEVGVLMPAADHRRKEIAVPPWGAVPDEPLPMMWRNDAGLPPERYANVWDMGERWLDSDTHAVLSVSWKEFTESMYLTFSIGERGHYHNYMDGRINAAAWDAPPATEWRSYFAGCPLQWGMDIESAIALLKDGKLAASVNPDFNYYLTHTYTAFNGRPMDVMYVFNGGLYEALHAINCDGLDRKAFETLEREIAAQISAGLGADEIVLRERPAADDNEARFKWFGASYWDNGETVVDMGGSFYGDDDPRNDLSVNFWDKRHPENNFHLEFYAEIVAKKAAAEQRD